MIAGGRRILVLESKASDVSARLSEAGFRVDDATEATTVVGGADAELLVLDLRGRGPKGATLLSSLEARHGDDDFLPLIVVASREEGIAALRRGADDFIAAPFDGEELVARVEKLLRFRSMQQRAARARGELERLASTDGLTSLSNQRALKSRLHQEFARAERYGNELSLVVFSVDRFCEINETFGHLVCDEVLREFAVLLGESVREADMLARYGGAEFVALLPQTSQQGAVRVVERVLEQMEKRRFGAPYAALQMSASAGLATFPGKGIDNAHALLRFADEALVEARRKGQSRLSIHAA